jgi:hypothetical protein
VRRVLRPQLEVGTGGARPIEELLDGGVLEQGGQRLAGVRGDVEGADRVLLLLTEVQGRAGGRQHGHVTQRVQDRADLGGTGQQLLDVVEDEQHPPTGQLLGQSPQPGLAGVGPDRQRERPGHLVGNERRVVHCGEGHERHAVGEVRRRLSRRADSEPGLAHSARSREGHQPVVLDQPRQLGHLPAATDEARSRHGQVVARRLQAAQRRKAGRQTVDHQLV